MSSIFSSHSDALKLVVDPRPYVAGEHVTGYVDFDPRIGQEEQIENVKVKLKGAVTTRVQHHTTTHGPNGQVQHQTHTYTGHEPLMQAEVTLWDEHYGNTGAPGVLQLPFDFVLPQNLPSSYHAGSSSQGGTISYAVEVKADRHGFFRRDKRIAQVLIILPNASPEQFAQAMQIRQGWQGPWTTIDKVESVKKHFWSDKSRVEAHLSIPAIPTLPVGVPIPICLTIITFTKMMKQHDTPDDAFDLQNDKQLFPAPPTDPSKLELLLRSNVHVSARGQTHNFTYEQEHLCGFGKRASPDAAARLQRTIAQPQWIPGEDGKGCWRREVRYDSQLVLQCSPSIETSILQCRYELDIEVPLPGMFNDFEWKMPISIQSGVTSAPQPQAPHFPNPQIGLPQDYYSGEYHAWDE